MNPFRQDIGIFYKDKYWAENIFQELKNNFEYDSISYIYRYYIQFNNGDIIRIIPANDSARGCRFTKSYIQEGIDIEIYNNIIVPTNLYNECYVINNYEGLLHCSECYNANQYYRRMNMDLTKAEAIQKIDELKDYIDKLDRQNIGFEDDELFILSGDEYKKYKDILPECNCDWWLRTKGINEYSYQSIAYVDGNGLVNKYGDDINVINGIRPVLKYKKTYGHEVGTRLIIYQFPFVCIDKENQYYIAETPIAFNVFDTMSNSYSLSYIREFLDVWKSERIK